MRPWIGATVAGGVILAGACRLPTQPPPGASGAEIYALQLCANCHGEAGEGGSNGPPLADLGAYWNAEDLADFLADPRPWEARDPRLARLAEGYIRPMNPYDNLSLDERLRLAAYLLEL